MRNERVKGWVGLAITPAIMLYLGTLYRLGGFGAGYALILMGAIVSVPPLLVFGCRRLGNAPVWLAAAAALPLHFYASGDTATTLLAWALCCGTPLAVSFFWQRNPQVQDLTAFALPAAGLIWLGGALVYCKLHFGGWDLYAMTNRVTARYIAFVDRLEQTTMQQVSDMMAAQYDQMFETIRSQQAFMGFFLICTVIYALVGVYFLSIFLADRSLPAEERWLGSWETMIPGRGVSMIFMIGYLLMMFFAEDHYRTLKAVFDLFGFFYVFTAVHRLLQLFRRGRMPAAVQWLLVAVLFASAFFSVGGGMLSPFLILMYLGWWFATTPRFKDKK